MDVLKILVTANYKYIPSLDDILETTAVPRLRNQLLEAEHYQLAVEVRQMVVYFFLKYYFIVFLYQGTFAKNDNLKQREDQLLCICNPHGNKYSIYKYKKTY